MGTGEMRAEGREERKLEVGEWDGGRGAEEQRWGERNGTELRGEPRGPGQGLSPQGWGSLKEGRVVTSVRVSEGNREGPAKARRSRGICRCRVGGRPGSRRPGVAGGAPPLPHC